MTNLGSVRKKTSSDKSADHLASVLVLVLVQSCPMNRSKIRVILFFLYQLILLRGNERAYGLAGLVTISDAQPNGPADVVS